jgi:NADPH:quinone reductase
MRAAWWEHNGAARDVLVLGEMPKPSPAPGEILVRMVTSGVNPSDVKFRAGRPPAFPRIIPHSDGAGVIEAVGQGVDAGRVGQRVWLWNGAWKRAHGTAAEYIVLPSAQAVPLGAETDFDAAACFGIPALTALHAVLCDGGVSGQRVLVQGGAGAVGHYAIQFARLLGAAQVLTTVSSEAKASHAMGAGADAAINYRVDDVAARVRALTDGHGVDRVVELDLAGNVASLPSLLAPGGFVACYGSNRPDASLAFFPHILGGIGYRFFIVYELTQADRDKAVNALNAWCRAGLLKHAVAARLPLNEIVSAHEAVESGTLIGNVVLDLQ